MLCICPTYTYGQTISNSGFEKNELDWSKTNNDILFLILESEAKEGSQSASIHNTSSSSYGVEQIITDIQPETNYEITAYIKLKDPAIGKTFFRIAWYTSSDGSGSQIKTADSEEITNVDWQKVTLHATSPKEAHSAKIRLLVSAGTALFDEISINKFIEIPTTPTVVPTQTPSVKNQPTVPTISNIFISEVMVYPSSGEPEWIEIHNQNDQSVILSDWYIDDTDNGGAQPKQFTIEIPAGSFGIYELSSSIFNNAGDQVRILNESREVVDSFSYSASQQNYSLGKKDNLYCIQIPSPGKQNNPCFNPAVVVTPAIINSTLTPIVLSARDQRISPKPSTPSTKKVNRIQTNMLVTPTQKVSDTTSPAVIEIPLEKQDHINKEPWLMLSGSYSFLACISLVSKLIFLRYT